MKKKLRHIRCLFVVVVPSLVVSSSCARDCVFMTRDMLRVMAQVETLLLVLENRLRQMEEALVSERRASRRTAEVTQQVVRTRPAGCRRGRDWETRDIQWRWRLGRVNTLFEATLESSTRRRPRCCSGWKQTCMIWSSLTTRR